MCLSLRSVKAREDDSDSFKDRHLRVVAKTERRIQLEHMRIEDLIKARPSGRHDAGAERHVLLEEILEHEEGGPAPDFYGFDDTVRKLCQLPAPKPPAHFWDSAVRNLTHRRFLDQDDIGKWRLDKPPA